MRLSMLYDSNSVLNMALKHVPQHSAWCNTVHGAVYGGDTSENGGDTSENGNHILRLEQTTGFCPMIATPQP